MTSDQGTSGKVADDSGEEVVAGEGSEPGGDDAGAKGAAERPAGEATMQDSTGVDPQDPIDEESPMLQPSD